MRWCPHDDSRLPHRPVQPGPETGNKHVINSDDMPIYRQGRNNMDKEKSKTRGEALELIAALTMGISFVVLVCVGIAYWATLTGCQNGDNPSGYKARLSGLAWNCQVQNKCSIRMGQQIFNPRKGLSSGRPAGRGLVREGFSAQRVRRSQTARNHIRRIQSHRSKNAVG